MALPFTDDFTDSNGTSLESHGAWAMQSGVSWEINTNRANPDSANNGFCYVTGESFPDDGFAEARIGAMTDSGSGRVGVGYRVAESSTKTGYAFWTRGDFGGTDRNLIKMVGGSITVLDSDDNDSGVDDVLRIECIGTDIYGLTNDVEELSASDSAIGSGGAGMFSDNHSGTSKALDDFEAGSLLTVITASGAAIIGAIEAAGNAFVHTVKITSVGGDNEWQDGEEDIEIIGSGFI